MDSKMNDKRRLLLPYGSIGKLAKDCGVSYGTARRALNGWYENDPTGNMMLVRERAIHYYGAR